MSLASVMANNRNDGGLIALLLFQCGLDALGRSGPFGRCLAGGIGCVSLITGLVFVIVYLANTDFSGDSDTSTTAGSNNVSMAKGEHHTPQDTANEAWWTYFILIFGLLFIFSMPVFIYVPRYMWRPERRTQPALAQGTPVVPVVQGKPVGAAPEHRPLLAFRVEGEQGEFV